MFYISTCMMKMFFQISQKNETHKQLLSMSPNKMSAPFVSMNTLPAPSKPSICIPNAHRKVDKELVRDKFNQLFGADAIKNIEELSCRSRQNQHKFKRFFIHFNQWPKTDEAQKYRLALLEGKEINIIYDDPWFWKCSAVFNDLPEGVNTRRINKMSLPTPLPAPLPKT